MTSKKILNFLLIITSLIGYLEWSGDSRAFLFEVEAEILTRAFTDPVSVMHPFIVIPFLGQLLLFITLFQQTPAKVLTYTSIAGLGLLLLFMFVIGVMSGNFKIIVSTIPFLATAVITIRHYSIQVRNAE